MIQVAVMGFGTIGSGVFDVINTNSEILKKNVGEDVCVKYVLDIREFPGQPVEKVLVHDVDTIVNDPEVSVVVETMGGVEPAFTFVSKALNAGKSVATSNKELVAKKGAELLALAKSKNVNFFFEASVGGGIPIIRPLLSCLTADDITMVSGILNGTTNYILTKMNREGTGFDVALKEAQANGYAERKPDADILGYDACRKIAILFSIVMGKRVDFEDIYTEGITAITIQDFAYANKLHSEIKLLATGWKEDGKVFAMVAPALVKAGNPLHAVSDVFNGILVHGNMVDDLMFYGRGAGKDATASAVVADVVEAAKNPGKTVYEGWTEEKQELADISCSAKQFLVRVPASSLPQAEKIFAGAQVLEQVAENEFGLVTPVMTEAAFEKAAAQVPGVIGRIRIQA